MLNRLGLTLLLLKFKEILASGKSEDSKASAIYLRMRWYYFGLG
jgi:hypothetical protein